MTLLNWTYWDSEPNIPTLENIKETAFYLLKQAYERKCTVSSGGFKAKYKKNRMTLTFEITECNT
jgi:hypothetical protein